MPEQPEISVTALEDDNLREVDFPEPIAENIIFLLQTISQMLRREEDPTITLPVTVEELEDLIQEWGEDANLDDNASFSISTLSSPNQDGTQTYYGIMCIVHFYPDVEPLPICFTLEESHKQAAVFYDSENDTALITAGTSIEGGEFSQMAAGILEALSIKKDVHQHTIFLLTKLQAFFCKEEDELAYVAMEVWHHKLISTLCDKEESENMESMTQEQKEKLLLHFSTVEGIQRPN